MKKLIVVLVFLLFSVILFAQSQYEVSRDKNNNSKVLKGLLSREDIEKDTAFAWFAANQKGYTPYAGAVEALKKNANNVRFIIFSGTWCSDSKNIIPKFYALTDAAGFSQDRITLFGTDRSKKTLGNMAEAMNIVNVPTIIIMKEGKEIGRVIEYGKFGLFDMELAEILKGITSN